MGLLGCLLVGVIITMVINSHRDEARAEADRRANDLAWELEDRLNEEFARRELDRVIELDDDDIVH